LELEGSLDLEDRLQEKKNVKGHLLSIAGAPQRFVTIICPTNFYGQVGV
jgi:hypothetical protein